MRQHTFDVFHGNEYCFAAINKENCSLPVIVLFVFTNLATFVAIVRSNIFFYAHEW